MHSMFSTLTPDCHMHVPGSSLNVCTHKHQNGMICSCGHHFCRAGQGHEVGQSHPLHGPQSAHNDAEACVAQACAKHLLPKRLTASLESASLLSMVWGFGLGPLCGCEHSASFECQVRAGLVCAAGWGACSPAPVFVVRVVGFWGF